MRLRFKRPRVREQQQTQVQARDLAGGKAAKLLNDDKLWELVAAGPQQGPPEVHQLVAGQQVCIPRGTAQGTRSSGAHCQVWCTRCNRTAVGTSKVLALLRTPCNGHPNLAHWDRDTHDIAQQGNPARWTCTVCKVQFRADLAEEAGGIDVLCPELGCMGTCTRKRLNGLLRWSDGSTVSRRGATRLRLGARRLRL